MTYSLAIAAAEMDAEMYLSATIEADYDRKEIVVISHGQIVARHAYKD